MGGVDSPLPQQTPWWRVAVTVQIVVLLLHQNRQDGGGSGAERVSNEHEAKVLRPPGRIVVHGPLDEILLFEFIFDVDRRLDHALVAEPVLPRGIQRQTVTLGVKIGQHVFHAERAPDADHNLAVVVVYGDEERSLADVHVIGGVNHFNLQA